jgi:predicted RNase H-like HicB family nuclease
MKKFQHQKSQFPIIIEQDEDGIFVVECPLFSGCYSQGDTLDEALTNIQEVLQICTEEKENQEFIKNYNPKSITFATVNI